MRYSCACVLAACLLAACLLLLVGGAARADALVGNLVEGLRVTGSSLGIYDHSQRFTTGASTSGYKITGIKIRLGSRNTSRTNIPKVRLFSQSPTGTKLADFNGPSTIVKGRGNYTFRPTSTLLLNSRTDYWMTIEDEGTAVPASLVLTLFTGEDAISAAGWDLANTAQIRAAGTNHSFVNFTDLSEFTVRYVANLSVEGTVRAANSPATGKPTISGSAHVGQILTADRGTIDDANGVPDVFVYQWIRVDGMTETDISGANEKTYRLTAADGDKQLKVTLSFIDNDGYDEARTGDPYPTGGNVDPQQMNSPATGKPTISGTARVGRILTADRGTIDDANGVPDVFDYQWIRVEGMTETDISGANEKTYRLTAADGGKQLKVTLSFIDNDGYDEARTGDPYPTGGNVAPRPANSPATGKPTISGTASVGQILTADRGTIDDANGVPDVFDYQWIRVEGMTETDISGANEKTYRLTADDGDTQFRVTLSFIDNEGYPEARTSDSYPTGGNVAPRSANSPATGKPTISGTARVGQILTADRGTVDDANGVPDVFDYQWIRVEGGNQTNISGANEKTYRLTADDEGTQFRVTLSFIDNEGYPEARTSDSYPTGGNVAPRSANSPATGKPTISGTARVGQILTADRGTVDDANGVPDVFDYQWIRVEGGTETDISGANEKTYRLTDDDEGTQFRVTLSFIDNEGYPEARTSDSYPTDGTVGRALHEFSGAISNGWLARFARTVGAQAVDAIEARLVAPRRPGFEGTVAGQSVSGLADAAPTENAAAEGIRTIAHTSGGTAGADDGPAFLSRAVPGRELLATTSFAFNRDSVDGGGVTLWGRGTASRFEGRQLGSVFDGDVTNAMLGADGSWSRALAGIVVSLAKGQGAYRTAAGSGGAEASLAAVFPYGRYDLSERITLWGMAGYGAGSMTLTPAVRSPMRPDIDFGMMAVGARGVLVEGEADWPTVTAKTDAMVVRARAERVPDLAATKATVTRLRLALEGNRRFALGGAAVLTPRLSLGVRRDAGDAETGAGADIGAGLALSDPARGLSAAVQARGLLTHDAKGFRERGLSAELTWNAVPADEPGLSLSLAQSLGGPAEGGADALLARPTLAGLGSDDGEGGLARRRFEARLGYGFWVWGGRWTAMPELGLGLSDNQRELRLGARLFERAATGLAVTLSVDGTRREHVDGSAGPEHEVGLALGWRLATSRDGTVAFEMRIEADRRESANRDVPPENAIGFTVTARW